MLRNIIGVMLGIAMLLLPSYTGAEISHAKVLEQVASVEAQYFDRNFLAPQANGFNRGLGAEAV